MFVQTGQGETLIGPGRQLPILRYSKTKIDPMSIFPAGKCGKIDYKVAQGTQIQKTFTGAYVWDMAFVRWGYAR